MARRHSRRSRHTLRDKLYLINKTIMPKKLSLAALSLAVVACTSPELIKGEEIKEVRELAELVVANPQSKKVYEPRNKEYTTYSRKVDGCDLETDGALTSISVKCDLFTYVDRGLNGFCDDIYTYEEDLDKRFTEITIDESGKETTRIADPRTNCEKLDIVWVEKAAKLQAAIRAELDGKLN